MRKAPKWRSWVPTSRKIRFSVQSALARAFPMLGYHFNHFPDNADLSLAPIELLKSFEERSARALPEEVQQFFRAHGALEQSRYPLPITPSGQNWLRIYELTDALVLSSTGSTVVKAQHRQIEAAAPNTMRFARLKDLSIQTPLINMLGLSSGYRHYYHFLCDVAFPLLYMLEAFEPRTFPLTILVRKDLPEFQREFYTHLAEDIPALTVEECGTNQRVHCKTLYHCTPAVNCEYRAPPSENAAAMVAAHYFSAYGIDQTEPPTKKLYIMRKNAKTRKILQEESLINQLQLRGFECVDPGDIGHKEQVNLFSKASIIVGTHGAGLTNILFSQANCKVFELFPADYIQSAYAWLSHMRGMSYTPIMGEKSGVHQHYSLSEQTVSDLLQSLDELELV
ncbi:glycosyltransferase family 61 protein [Pseudovibrio sp. Tun.PSC04-5.I4]|uniref:glycosyltransferase family 61 protein n=1 Tax=Pseudovibrio sp. Tun.PSC04-5.I4 TaxID=1798213 RepID=UPI0008814DF1|nr:glycosyltransferase family 61 protein [Pseudovibrio sp. Tun.PSC04-5.I4]SDQ80374.1 Protein of unknown function [Pseudovibrio sp. Tun.PSC04-5.I4]